MAKAVQEQGHNGLFFPMRRDKKDMTIQYPVSQSLKKLA